ncbi:MAG: hypothetical protein I3273_01430 [Candidatus Moeniiplasma glomeromycotorum]|nr:hypothetical protein [Candidatus Moeniiplasma glomeromycotorum]MCE8167216.1 hypothetical protein [Candidatus Moeniiplasma glomeromycotorum]MCE8168771.1 hypothetical protein [Candidatus Moeniiplasma glomeromycotorum]
MLCSKCHQKIPPGEEIQKASNFYWRAGWYGGGGGSEIVCKKCARKERKWAKRFFIFFMSLMLLSFMVPLLVWSLSR